MSKGGRPTKYKEDTNDKVIEYLKICKEDNTVPSAAGLAVHLDVGKRTLYDWANKHKEFSHTLDTLNAIQEATLLTKGLKNEYNSTIVKLMLANHGYSDKQQTDITTNGENLSPLLVKFVGEDNKDD